MGSRYSRIDLHLTPGPSHHSELPFDRKHRAFSAFQTDFLCNPLSLTCMYFYHCWNTLKPATLLTEGARNSWLPRISLGVSFGFVWPPWTPFGQPWLWITCGWVLFENRTRKLSTWICSQNPLRLVQIQPSPWHEIRTSCRNCSPH